MAGWCWKRTVRTRRHCGRSGRDNIAGVVTACMINSILEGRSMRRVLFLFSVAACFTPTLAEAHFQNRYAKWHLGQPYGFRDLKILPTRWKIRGLSWKAGNDFTVAVALRRAAIHARGAGFSHIFTVSLKSTCSSGFSYVSRFGPDACESGSVAEEVNAVAVGMHGTDAPPPCEETGRWSGNCRVFVVDELLRSTASFLNISMEEEQAELEALRKPRQ